MNWSVVAVVGLMGFQQKPSPPADLSALPVVERDPAYKLVWADEFEGGAAAPEKPDASKWRYEHGFIRNNEKQFYTDRTENVRVEDGKLIIEARKEPYSEGGKTADFTSGSIETRRGDGTEGCWLYGRVEVRAKISQARGTWPAIWMLGNWGDSAGGFKWPDHGEIDVMENVGMTPDIVYGTVHTKAYNHVRKTAKGKPVKVPNLSDDFHVYAVDWTKEKIEFSVDGRVYFTFDNEHKTEAEWPFDHPQWLKLNFAIGGAWGGQKGIDDTAFPQRMTVDWVRVYQK